jgi:hypothetical protein
MMTSHWAEPPFRHYEPPRANGYTIVWRKLRNATQVLRFKQQLRHVHLLATHCAACLRHPGRRHRPASLSTVSALAQRSWVKLLQPVADRL